MLKRSLQCAIALTGMAIAAPQAWADAKASLIRHTAKTGNWMVTKVCAESKGKCKIYDTEPEYDDSNNITTEPLTELKAEGSTFTFNSGGATSSGKDYWIVYYPKLTNMGVKLEFKRGADPKKETTTTLQVDGIYMADAFAKGPTITFATKVSGKAKFVKANFMKGWTLLSNLPKPFITLD